jgi:hypothetical protein
MSERLPEIATYDDVVDPLRREVVAGRTVIVLGGAAFHGHVREALAVAGRSCDHVSVRFHVDEAHYAPLDASCRRPVRPFTSTNPGDDGFEWLPDMRAYFARPEDAMAVLPALDVDEATAAGATVHVTSGPDWVTLPYARWLHGLACRRAEAEGRPAPVLIFDDPYQRPGHAFAPVEAPGSEIGLHTDPRRPMGGYGTTAAIARAFGFTGEGEAEWRRFLADHDAGISARIEGNEAWGERDGRTAFVRRRRMGNVVAGPTYAFEILPDRSVGGVRITAEETGDATLAHWVRIILRGGLCNLSGSLDDLDASRLIPMKDPADYLLDACGNGLPSRAALAAGERIDRQLSDALLGEEGREALLRLVGSDPALASRRRDFLVTWPFFSDLLLAPSIRAVVDAGEPTVPAIAGHLGITPAVARRFVGVPGWPFRWSNRRLHERGNTRALLAAIGHDRLPPAGNAEEWTAFLTLVGGLRGMAMRAGIWGADPETEAALLLGTPGRTWNGRCLAVHGSRGGQDLMSVGDVVRSLAGFLSALAGGGRAVAFEAAMAVLAEHGSLVRLAGASARWHDERRLVIGVGGLSDKARWPVPFDPVDLGDGWTVHALDGVAALRAEGAAEEDDGGMAGLAHCVGGYGAACMAGESIVLSIRHDAGSGPSRDSTAELVPGPGAWRIAGRPYRLSQHRGRLNGAPSPEAERRLSKLSYLLVGGKVGVREEALDGRAPETVVGDLRAEALALLPAWRRVLPAPYSALDADGLLAALDGIESGFDAKRRAMVAAEELEGRLAG